MSRNWEFQLPTRVRFGRGGLRRLGDVARELGQSAFLVGYRDAATLEPHYDRARRSLAKSGLTVAEFFEVAPDPEAALAVRGAERLRAAGCDLVVAVGGGSVIDAAKGIAALARLGGAPWDYAAANRRARPVTEAVPLVAVPTTAGTGSEVTEIAVITQHGVSSIPGMALKVSIHAAAIRPAVALVDPDLSVGSAPTLTAACGADALGHAIESCLSRRANPIASTLAGRAVAWIVAHLGRAVANPDDPAPREPLALAATLAGAAFDAAGVVLAHAIAQALGGLLDLPHGVGVATATPLILRFNAEPCVEQYADLARCCGISGESPRQRAERFVERIAELLRGVGLPDRVAVPDDAPPDLIDRLVRNALESTPAAVTLNPRKTDEETLRNLFAELTGSR